MGFSKSKRNNGAWCVLLVGLLLAAAAKGDCPDECEVYRGVDRAKYVECIHWCHFGAHPQLKRFARGDASKASKWSSAVLAAELNKNQHNVIVKLGTGDCDKCRYLYDFTMYMNCLRINQCI
jgi:hypothetical protein